MLNDVADKVPKQTVLHAYLQETARQINSPQVQLASVSNYEGIPGNGQLLRSAQVERLRVRARSRKFGHYDVGNWKLAKKEVP